MTYYSSNGYAWELSAKLKDGEGGEGIIYSVCNEPTIVAKIFKKKDLRMGKKIEALSRLPWPADVQKYLVLPKITLYEDVSRKIVSGYIMERIEYTSKLKDIYSEYHPLSIYKKSCIAQNLCKAVIAVHKMDNIIMGDFNSKNILVDPSNGDIKIIDTDSLHMVAVSNKKIYRFPCLALDPILFMPEIIDTIQSNKVRRLDELKEEIETFTKYTDYYCLAYHIHMLLMAQKPFGAAMSEKDINDSVPAPTPQSMACKGQYAYVNLPARTSLPKIYPDFDILTPKLQELFIRAFKDGASNPKLRPSPQEFLIALEEYTDGLRYCLCRGFDHYLYKNYKNSKCEWCRVELEKHQKRIIFDSDFLWMTEDELLHLTDIDTEDLNKSKAYMELGHRYSGFKKRGIKFNRSVRKSKKYYNKALKIAKRCKDKTVETAIRKCLSHL